MVLYWFFLTQIYIWVCSLLEGITANVYIMSLHSINAKNYKKHITTKVENKLDNYLNLAKKYLKQKPTKTLEYVRKGLVLAKKYNNKEATCRLYSLRGVVYLNRGSYNEALQCFELALALAEKIDDKNLKARMLNSFGVLHTQKKNYELALHYYYDALTYNMPELNPVLYANIATIYSVFKDYNKVLQELEKALVAAKNLENQDLIVSTLINIGVVYGEQKKHDTAIKYQLRALAILEANNEDVMLKVKCHIYLGNTYEATGNYKQALKSYQEALRIAKKYNLYFDAVKSLVDIGKMYMIQKEYPAAIRQLEHALSIAQNASFNHEIIECLKCLYQCNEAENNYQNATRFLKELVKVQEDYYTTKEQDNIANVIKDKENEISLLTKQKKRIEKQNELLEQSNNELKQYTYIVSHDLKEPLRSIRKFSKILVDKYSKGFADEAAELLRFVTDNAEHMNHLLLDFKKYASLNNKNFKKETLNLNVLVEQVKYLLNSLIVETNTKLEVEELPDVYANRLHFMQLFQNLIHNAIKFRQKNVPCQIIISAKQQQDQIVFQVKDNGIGVPENQQELIFRIFNRLDYSHEGTGIGLSICEKIVRFYDGKIWVKSMPKQGCTFCFTIPNAIKNNGA